jgi:hypothetical protein
LQSIIDGNPTPSEAELTQEAKTLFGPEAKAVTFTRKDYADRRITVSFVVFVSNVTVTDKARKWGDSKGCVLGHVENVFEMPIPSWVGANCDCQGPWVNPTTTIMFCEEAREALFAEAAAFEGQAVCL